MISLLTLSLHITGIIMIGLAIYVRRRQPNALGSAFSITLLLSSMNAISYGLELSAPTLEQKILFSQLGTTFFSFLGLGWLSIGLFYMHSGWLTYQRLTLLAIIPLANTIFTWTTPWHDLYRKNYYLFERDGFTMLGWENGLFAPLFTAANFGYIMLFIVIIGRGLRYGTMVQRARILLIQLSAILPLVGGIIFYARTFPIEGFNPMPNLMLLTALVLAWTLFRLSWSIIPLARHKVVENLTEGMLVLDPEHHLLDANPSARRVLQLTDSHLGLRVEDIVSEAPQTTQAWKSILGGDPEIRIGDSENARTLRVSMSAIQNDMGDTQSTLLVLHDITEQKKAAEFLRTQNQYLAALQETALGLLESANINVLLEKIAHRAGKLIQTENIFLDLIEEGQDVSIPKINTGLYASTNLPPEGNRRGEGLVGAVWETGKPMIVDDYDQWEQRTANFPKKLVACVAGLPLIASNRVIGVLGVAFSYGTAKHFRPHDVENLKLFADLAAVAIENARLFEITEESRKREAELNHITHILTGVLDLETILKHTLKLTTDLLGADMATIGMVTPDKRGIRYMFGYNVPESNPAPKEAMSSGIGWQTIQEGRSIFIPDYGNDPRAIHAWKEAGLHSLISVPLITGGEPIGAMGIFTKKRAFFTEQHTQRAEAIARQAALAIQNVRHLEREHQRGLRQELLFKLTSHLAGFANDEEEIWQKVPETLHDSRLRYESITMLEWNEEKQERTVRGIFNSLAAEHENPPVGFRLHRGQGITESVIQSQKQEYFADISQTSQHIFGFKTGCEVDTPIFVGKEFAGILVIDHPHNHIFEEADLNTMQSAATQIGIALGRARLLRQTQQQRDELALINEISQASAAELELDALIEMVGRRVEEIFASQSVYLAFYDAKEGIIRTPYWSVFGKQVQAEPMKYGQGLTSIVIKNAAPLTINENFEEESKRLGARLLADRPYGLPESWLGVPMLVGEQQVLGVISAQRFTPDHPFTESDVRLLSTIAANVGIAMQNAQLYEQARAELKKRTHAETRLRSTNERLTEQLDKNKSLQARLRDQAIRDPLTKLFNRRYLQETFKRELARARREQSSISILMLDVDRFKQVNDNYGHKVGDSVLKMLAHLINNHIRAEDIACRYGGEEFMLVMPQTSAETARERAEFLRAKFASLSFSAMDSQFNATISIGIACFPYHGTSSTDLFALADQALYRAKAEGRNRVCIASFPEKQRQ